MPSTIDHIDLNLLRVFQAIVEERSLTRAGQRLNLSQPAISYSLSRLRTLFDDPLFVRTRAGMQPTPTALELSKIIARALASVRDALRLAERFDAASSTRTFRVSLSDVGEMAYLPPVCQALQQHAPHVRLSIDPLPADQIEDALRTSRLDVAIGNLPALTASTEHRLLFEETYVCMTRRRAGLPTGESMTLPEFLAASHVRVMSTEHSHRSLDDALRASHVNRTIALDMPHFSALPQILLRTDLIATVPRGVARLFNYSDRFAIYELPVQLPPARVTIHWHHQFDRDEGIVWLRELLSEYVARQDW